MQIQIQIASLRGHEVTKIDPRDSEQVDEIAQEIHEKLQRGWFLVGGKKNQKKDFLAGQRSSLDDVKAILKGIGATTMMVDIDDDNPDHEPIFYEKMAMLPAQKGG